MSQRKLKRSKLNPERIRIGCVECLNTVVVPFETSTLQVSLWKSGKWVLTGEAITGSPGGPMFTGELSVLCPACQDRLMDPELLRAAREVFSKRYDGAPN